MSTPCSGQIISGSISSSCLLGSCPTLVIQFKTLTSGTVTISGSSTCNATFQVKVNGNVVATVLQGQYVTLNLEANSDVAVYAILPFTLSVCTATAYACYTGQTTGSLPPPNNTFTEIVTILVIVLIALIIIAAIVFFLKNPGIVFPVPV